MKKLVRRDKERGKNKERERKRLTRRSAVKDGIKAAGRGAKEREGKGIREEGEEEEEKEGSR